MRLEFDVRVGIEPSGIYAEADRGRCLLTALPAMLLVRGVIALKIIHAVCDHVRTAFTLVSPTKQALPATGSSGQRLASRCEIGRNLFSSFVALYPQRPGPNCTFEKPLGISVVKGTTGDA
jgi:hypothetical protein